MSNDKPSVHGMLLMGTSKIYASHLPMFHTPHDYQIILEIKLPKKLKEIYQQDRVKNSKETVYTLVPERFVLPEKVHTKNATFKASIYRGHFERGGKEIIESIEVSIKKLIYYKKFDNTVERPINLTYFLIGNKKEQFLIHLVSKQPDFDEILSVSSDKKTIRKIRKKGFVMLEVNEKDVRKPFSWKSDKFKVINSDENIFLRNSKQLYLEFGDLN